MAEQVVQVLIEIGHRAWYRKKTTPDRTHDWILYVRGSEGNDLSHFVEKVVFNLHQSFNPPKRVLKSPPYELRESGYGEFFPIIDIYFKNKGEKGAQRKITIQYFLNLNREDSPPIDNVRPEKLKFYSPAEEFLEKVLKSGGVILGHDGCPLPTSKPRPSAVADLQSNSAFDSRNHDASDFLVAVDSAAKSATQLAKRRKRSTEANPMSNDSNSSNESIISRHSSKSDPLDKDSDAARGTKRKMHTALFELIDDDSSKKKKKQAPSQTSEKPDSNKSRSAEQKPAKVDPTEDSKHRSSKDDGHKRSSSKSSHHRRDDGRRDHREKSTHSHTHSKPKSGDRNSRSSSRTPSKVKSSESLSGSRVHGSSSSSHGLSTHHRSSSSSSRHHSSSSKSSKVEGSRHSGSQSQKGESSMTHRESSSSSSSKHRTSADNSLSRKTDIQIRLSPVDIQILDSINARSGSSTRKLEASSGNRIGPSPEGFSSQKPNHFSPVKKRPKTAVLASPVGYPPPTFDPKSYDDPFASANRIRPKYDKLLDDMKSDDEEEDGEIRSPVATEPPDPVPWKPASSGDRKDEKSKESSLDRKKSSSSRTSSSATPRLEKPERFPFGTERPSPTKAKSEWSSSLSSEKTSPESVSFSGSQVKAKKSHAKENVDSDSRLSKKPSTSKSGSQKDFVGGQRTSAAKQTMKGLPPPSEVSSFAVKSEADEKDDKDFFKVETQWDNSHTTGKTNDVALKKEIETYGVKSEFTLYDEKKSNDITTKSEPLKGMTYSDRAPNGELLMSLIEMKEKINRVTSAALLNRIVDVIQAAGKLKSDDEALEFDFCQLDHETMQRVKQILETVSD